MKKGGEPGFNLCLDLHYNILLSGIFFSSPNLIEAKSNALNTIKLDTGDVLCHRAGSSTTSLLFPHIGATESDDVAAMKS